MRSSKSLYIRDYKKPIALIQLMFFWMISLSKHLSSKFIVMLLVLGKNGAIYLVFQQLIAKASSRPANTRALLLMSTVAKRQN